MNKGKNMDRLATRPYVPSILREYIARYRDPWDLSRGGVRPSH